MKSITLCMALAIVVSMMAYSAFMVGTLFHELTHASHAVQLKAIEVNYDSSGAAYAQDFIGDTEEYAYFNGAIITTTLLLLGTLSMIVMLRYKYE